MQSGRGEEGMNLLSAVSNFSRPCPGELRLRHTAGTEGAPSRRELLQMSLLQNSKAVQTLLKHDKNPVSSLNLLSCLGDFSLFHWNNNPTSEVKIMAGGRHVWLSSSCKESGWGEGMEQPVHYPFYTTNSGISVSTKSWETSKYSSF